jgi:hypothetical protein
VTRSEGRETLLCWLDSQGDAWVEVTCPQHGLVAGLNLAAVKPLFRDRHDLEENRRTLLHHAFRLAGIVEGATCAGVSVPSPRLRLTTTASSLVQKSRHCPTQFGSGGR